MKKSVRKSLSIVLILVLICTLAVTTYAATVNYAEESFYRFDAVAEASIALRSTSICVTAEGLSNPHEMEGDVSCAYKYETPAGRTKTGSFTQIIDVNGNTYSYTRNHATSECSKMLEATYYLAVEIRNANGSYEFSPDALVVSYS